VGGKTLSRGVALSAVSGDRLKSRR
jgi:hypothetical protein